MNEPQATVVTNETPRRLWLRGAGQDLLLPPFGERELPAEQRAALALDSLEEAGVLSCRPVVTSRLDDYVTAVLTVALLYVLLAVSLDFGVTEWMVGGGVGLALLMAAGLWHLKAAIRPWLAQWTSFATILVVGIVLPGAVIFAFVGASLSDAAPSPGGPVADVVAADPAIVIASLLQLVFISSASLLPALLYYLFDRMQLSTLRRRFLHDIFRLDPTLRTLGEVRAKYGDRLDEAYGPADGTAARRYSPGTRLPILVCTLVLTLGWLLTLPPVSGLAGANVDSAAAILRLVTPQHDPLTFAFLGAYFFGVTMILRRYVRGDLKPKAYSSITVRVFVTIILAWVLRIAVPIFGSTLAAGAADAGWLTTGTQALLLVTVFLGAAVPETVLAYLQEALRMRIGFKIGGDFQHKQPLRDLEGIDLYDRARLLDEGVVNVESLAHHDLPELIFTTRIPIARLVDWIDQAILYLHVDRDMAARLRACGVRTATDLERVMLDDDGAPDGNLSARLAALLHDDAAPGSSRQRTAIRLETILRALGDDEWLQQIRHWRRTDTVGVETLTLSAVPAKAAAQQAPLGGAAEPVSGVIPILLGWQA